MFCFFAIVFSIVTEMTSDNYESAKAVYVDSFIKSYQDQGISLEVLRKHNWEEYATALRSNFDETVADSRNKCFVDTDDHGHVVGVLLARFSGTVLYLAEMAVTPTAQKKGVSKALICACIEKMKSENSIADTSPITVTAYTRLGNTSARTIYVEKLGWKEWANTSDAIAARAVSAEYISTSEAEDLIRITPYYDPAKYVFFTWTKPVGTILERLTPREAGATAAAA